MSISNYTELQAAVSAWMHRADLAARVPDFIRQGEAYLNRKLRTTEMEAVHAFNMTPGNRVSVLPSRYLEAQSLFYLNPNDEIVYVDASILRTNPVAGKPCFFTIRDGIEFERAPDAAYSCGLHHFRGMDIAADMTNWLLSSNDDLYLYASIVAAAVYIKDDGRLATIKALLTEAVDDLNELAARRRGSQVAQLRTELAGFNT